MWHTARQADTQTKWVCVSVPTTDGLDFSVAVLIFSVGLEVWGTWAVWDWHKTFRPTIRWKPTNQIHNTHRTWLVEFFFFFPSVRLHDTKASISSVIIEWTNLYIWDDWNYSQMLKSVKRWCTVSWWQLWGVRLCERIDFDVSPCASPGFHWKPIKSSN